MSTITAVLDLSNIPDQMFDPTLKLRAAVVYGDAVLGSITLSPQTPTQELPFSITFAAPYLPGAILPCLVRLIIGPDVPDHELLSLGTMSVEVTLGSGDYSQLDAAIQEDEFRIALGTIRLDISLYDFFRGICTTYTIRGRVVCLNWRYNAAAGRFEFSPDPVPGATVEAYDVNHVLAWSSVRLSGTAVTDVNGFFSIPVSTCCFSPFRWELGDWTFNHEAFARLIEALRRAGLAVPTTPIGPRPTPDLIEQLIGGANPGGRYALTAGTSVLANSLAPDVLRQFLPPSLELETMKVYPWFGSASCAPNIKFRVTQMCGNELQVIRDESNAEIRYAIPRSLEVFLLANDQACCLPSYREPECPGCMKVTHIGCVPTNLIAGEEVAPELRGYANVGQGDRYFHGTPTIAGAMDTTVDYFRVQIRHIEPDSAGAWTAAEWKTLDAVAMQGFRRSYWGPSIVPVEFAPRTFDTVPDAWMITRRHYEELHPAVSASGRPIWFEHENALFNFNTQSAKTPDGLYEMRFLGYTADGADNILIDSERVLTTCGEQGSETVYIRIDNRQEGHAIATHRCGTLSEGIVHACTNEPDVYIREITLNESLTSAGRRVAACDVVELTANDTLTIHFTVSVPRTSVDGHLGNYTMTAEYGEASIIFLGEVGAYQPDPTFEVGPDYRSAILQGAVRPHWYGGSYKITVPGSAFPACCGYVIHLNAWKRSACSSSHGNRYTRSITIVRTDLCGSGAVR